MLRYLSIMLSFKWERKQVYCIFVYITDNIFFSDWPPFADSWSPQLAAQSRGARTIPVADPCRRASICHWRAEPHTRLSRDDDMNHGIVANAAITVYDFRRLMRRHSVACGAADWLSQTRALTLCPCRLLSIVLVSSRPPAVQSYTLQYVDRSIDRLIDWLS